MRYLVNVLRDYCQLSRPLRSVLNQGTQQLEPGDIVAIYGDDIVYGVILERHGDWYNAIYLTTQLVLGGAGYKVDIGHLVNSAKVTPINFYVKPEYCEIVKKLSKDEFDKVVCSFNQLSGKKFSGIWKKFYTFETQRLQLLYDMFLSEIIDR